MGLACSVADCDRPHYARGLCNAHYQRLQRIGDVQADKPLQSPQGGPCSVSQCERPSRVLGLCNAHYSRQRIHGDVRADDPVGKHWRPDNPHWRKVGKKRNNTDGYIEVWNPDHPNAHTTGYVLEHRMVMADHLGRPLLPDEIPHHKNGDRTDNRIENLELCLRRQPPGQRVADLLPWARDLVERYDGHLFIPD